MKYATMKKGEFWKRDNRGRGHLASYNLSGIIIFIILTVLAIALVVYIVKKITKPRKELQQKVEKLEDEVRALKKDER
ncbi:hypothetical protein [Desertibacillus haloalkaliphilus]|uniref:hypothetical protein n=1 Tax=Desertibacillus haloalkaliphilus TaxID=1328930 RepID=UPI001C262208|nr:hypothetical protein [Desertibacillus haloalkaliphilus]